MINLFTKLRKVLQTNLQHQRSLKTVTTIQPKRNMCALNGFFFLLEKVQILARISIGIAVI